MMEFLVIKDGPNIFFLKDNSANTEIFVYRIQFQMQLVFRHVPISIFLESLTSQIFNKKTNKVGN